MEENRRTIPVVPLKNVTVLPGMLMNFDIARRGGIAAVEQAMKDDCRVLLVSQRRQEEEYPDIDGLYGMGTVAYVKQTMKVPGNAIRILASGESKAKLLKIVDSEECLVGEIEYCIEPETELTPAYAEAQLRRMRELIDDYVAVNPQINKLLFKQIQLTDNVDKMVEQIAVHVAMPVLSRQRILEAEDIIQRCDVAAGALAMEIEVLRIKQGLSEKVREKVDKNQREYVLREQMNIIRKELGETDSESETERYRRETAALEAPENVKEKLIKEISRLESMSPSSSESAVCRGYIEELLALPWEKRTEEVLDIKNAKRVLNRDHYGLEKVKERMLEFLAVRSLTKKGDSPIICLVGPPGTGKTSIARSVAEALNKKYVRICLGGVRDEAEIRGHRRTYIGAMPGRIISGLKGAQVKNPLMLLDEIDKISSDYKGDTASALLEVLDSEQNSRFVDHYVELPVDLSEVFFIATANSTQTIPGPLLDRMELIEVSGYTENEKLHIAKEHLVAKQLDKNGLKSSQLSFTQKALSKIIGAYTREAGVRGLERRLGEICRKAACELIENGTDKKIKVTEKNLTTYLGKEKYHKDKAGKKPEIGIVHGLAWTSVGGDTLSIEVNTMPGKGQFELTGQLGEVMKESAKAGISYIRSISGKLGVDERYFETHDIHIHIPEGAVPKDGPSAGITMATAMISAVTGRYVRPDVAMSGEITLRGRVLPVGGLKEKLLAAKMAGIKLVIVPADNRPDIDELSEEITGGMEIEFATSMDEVLKLALL